MDGVVEGPQRRSFATRGRAMAVGIALVFTGGNAWAAACIPVQDLVALRAMALRQQLTVAALQCNRSEAFKSFTRSYDEPLRQSDAVVVSFFRKRNPLSGTTDYNNFKKALTDLWVLSSSKDNTDFCSNAESAFRMIKTPDAVPLQAIAANISTGRYVACAPQPSSTNVTSAERTQPARIIQANVIREAEPAPAKAIPVVNLVKIIPTQKPVIVAAVTRKDKKPAPVVASKAAGPGVPLSRYAMAMDSRDQRSPYEATPEELMTEADLPLDAQPALTPAPTIKVTRTAGAARTMRAERTIVRQEPVREDVARQAAVPPEAAPQIAEDYASRTADYAQADNDIAREIDVEKVQRPYAEQRMPDGSSRYYYRNDDPAADNGYAPRDERYGADSYYRRANARPQDYRDNPYQDTPRDSQASRYRERYASAPDYGDASYDRYDQGYSGREAYDPYYGR